MSRLWLTALVALSACADADPVEGPAETAPCDDCATLDDVEDLRAEIDELRAQLPVVVAGSCDPNGEPTVWKTSEQVTILSVRSCVAASDTYAACYSEDSIVFIASDVEAKGYAVAVGVDCIQGEGGGSYETYQITYLPG